jgi:hypothetical protein
MNNASSDKDKRERISAILKGYIAFIAALLFLLLANGDKWPLAWLPGILFALSLPSLIACEVLIYKDAAFVPGPATWTDALIGLSALLGGIPSLAGVSIVVGHIRWYAGIGFAVLSLFWLFAIARAVDQDERVR